MSDGAGMWFEGLKQNPILAFSTLYVFTENPYFLGGKK